VLIAGNWKMFKGVAETAEFCRALREADLGDVDVVVCPPYTALATAVQVLADTDIGVFAQNVHWEDEGAFTGEISNSMLLELGVYGTIVGHSERRQYFCETDATVARRVEGALQFLDVGDDAEAPLRVGMGERVWKDSREHRLSLR